MKVNNKLKKTQMFTYTKLIKWTSLIKMEYGSTRKNYTTKNSVWDGNMLWAYFETFIYDFSIFWYKKGLLDMILIGKRPILGKL